MKVVERRSCAAIIAISCTACGAVPAESSLGGLMSDMAQAVVGPKGAPPFLRSGIFINKASAFSYAGGGLELPVDNVYAISGRVTVGNPVVRKSTDDAVGVHSLAEVSAQDALQEQTVEIGWIVYEEDQTPRLFVFYWTDGTPRCNPERRAHYDCQPFVSTSHLIKPDMALPVGATVDLGIAHVDSGPTAGWHFFYDGADFGYLPDSAWNVRFRSVETGMWFGEVAGSTATRCSAMGNGRGGSDTGATSFATLQYAARGERPTNAAVQLVQTETSRYEATFGAMQYRAPVRFGGPYFTSSSRCPALSK